MERFRRPLPTAELPLPPELRGHIGAFLGQAPAGDMQLALLLIRFGAHERMKRCTPCARCHVTRTYTQFCTTCDAELWLDM